MPPLPNLYLKASRQNVSKAISKISEGLKNKKALLLLLKKHVIKHSEKGPNMGFEISEQNPVPE
jgi:hypothetical protein